LQINDGSNTQFLGAVSINTGGGAGTVTLGTPGGDLAVFFGNATFTGGAGGEIETDGAQFVNFTPTITGFGAM